MLQQWHQHVLTHICIKPCAKDLECRGEWVKEGPRLREAYSLVGEEHAIAGALKDRSLLFSLQDAFFLKQKINMIWHFWLLVLVAVWEVKLNEEIFVGSKKS